MKKLLSIGLAMVLACCLFADTSIAGKWTMSTETPHGTMKGPLQIRQDGSNITGTYDLAQMGSMKITGKLEGDKVSFSMEVPGADLTVNFTGKVEGDKMSGSSDKAGNWSATKE